MQSTENQNVKNRLLQFIMFKNISIRNFEIQIGVSNAYISNLKKQPREDVIKKILNVYPELNKVWLLTGEGEMLKGATVEAVKTDLQNETVRMLLAELAEQRKTIARLTAIIDRLTSDDARGKNDESKAV